jgi:hypothetical protein
MLRVVVLGGGAGCVALGCACWMCGVEPGAGSDDAAAHMHVNRSSAPSILRV